MSTVYLAALSAIITTFITTATSFHLPQLLHPLFGSIPSSLCQPHAERASFVAACIILRTALAGRFNADVQYSIINPLVAFSSSLYAVPLMIRPLAVLGGDNLGPTWGPLLPLLILGTLVNIAGLWLVLMSVTIACGKRQLRMQSNARPALVSLALFAAVKVILSRRLYPAFQDAVSYPLPRPETTICYIALGCTALSIGVTAFNIYIPPQQRTLPGREESSNFGSILRVIQLTTTVLAIQRACFAIPKLPYLAASNDLRVLNVTYSVSGMVMVADNLKDGYRFIRCDHSLLGGRWLLPDQDPVDDGLGDTIFATFVLQEACRLAACSDAHIEGSMDLAPRTLVIGLGAGIAADAMMKHNHDVDIIEYDPAVFDAAQRYLGLTSPRSVHLVDGAAFVTNQAISMRGEKRSEDDLYDFVIHDCFTGGSVPHELFTVEFWEQLSMITASTAIIAVNFAGAVRSRATQTVLYTLVQAFSQCRAFTDTHGMVDDPDGRELSNIVIFCTNTQSSILTFRKPHQADFLNSQLRRHILTDFLTYEIPIQSVLPAQQSQRNEPLLKQGSGSLDKDQVESALTTWTAMRKIMPVAMWRVY